PLFYSALDTNQAYTELVFCHFSNRTHPTVTQVINIIHNTFTVTDGDQCLHHINDIFVGQGAFTSFNLTTQSTIELHPAHSGQIITLLTEEQILEKRLG